jgi:S1-C subfamily serine protease
MANCVCPDCDARLQIPDNMAGKQVRCPKCKSPFTVPAAKGAAPRKSAAIEATPKRKPETGYTSKKSAPALSKRKAADDDYDDDDDDDDDYDDEPRSKSKRKKKSGPPWVLISVLGGVAAVVLIAVISVIFFVSGSSKPKAAAPIEAAVAPPPAPPREDPPPAPDPKPKAPKKKANRDKEEMSNIQIGFELPKDPLPSAITPENTQRVKKATAQIRVTFADGSAEGSGFFAFEQDMVITNAHVVGMLHTLEKPKKVEVVINSGQPDEFRRTGTVVGVDQDEDLAILRLEGKKDDLPEPLIVDFLSPLTELQKVYIFGFPFGVSLGKEVTVSESTISSLRRNKDGLFNQIQVNGGMQPGNSGGPVVDARGNVVGVAVAGISGTNINFAVPGEKVVGMAQGRVLESDFDEPYRDRDGKTVRMPVRIACLDPLSRVKKVSLEFWTGPTGPSRPGGRTAAVTKKDDGAKTNVELTYAANQAQATADLTLPAIPEGHVLWVQPSLTHPSGRVSWSHAFPVPSASSQPIERIPANLVLDVGGVRDRTLDLTAKLHFQLHSGSRKLDINQKLEADALEVVRLREKTGDFDARISIGKAGVNTLIEDKSLPFTPTAIQEFKKYSYGFVLSPEGRLIEMGATNFPPSIEPAVRRSADGLANLLKNSYQATCFIVSGRETKPQETWKTNVTMQFDSGSTKTPADVVFTCTFEGVRTIGESKHGVIRFEGEAKPRFESKDILKAKVKGYAMLDLEKGYFSKVQVAIKYDIELVGIVVHSNLETTLARSAGNPRGIRPAGPFPPPTLGAGGNTMIAKASSKIILQKNGMLQASDPMYSRSSNPHHVESVNFTAGNVYQIDLSQAPGQRFDPLLFVEDPAGVVVAQDDDGGSGLDARVFVQARQTGAYRIIITAYEPNTTAGSYSLKVTEFEAPKAVTPKKGVPKGKGKVSLEAPENTIARMFERAPSREILARWEVASRLEGTRFRRLG